MTFSHQRGIEYHTDVDVLSTADTLIVGLNNLDVCVNEYVPDVHILSSGMDDKIIKLDKKKTLMLD